MGGRPANVVLIVSDDQGYHDLGCFGAKDVHTPHLDRLASEGTRLTSFDVAWNACTPSRASFLTGRYPQRNGTYDMTRNDRVDDGYLYPPEEYVLSPGRTCRASRRLEVAR
ncbi:sulfatase-like hydrolase/transferase [Bremerella cremea]|uniref:sulfatase-like hydrolase/transferase n=1 Tax=Bremerella cremea TaxID=1031537 RepID=UPI001F41AD03|nr:sulfatase-like hydrolase/transferase [Bremerella cremea]